MQRKYPPHLLLRQACGAIPSGHSEGPRKGPGALGKSQKQLVKQTHAASQFSVNLSCPRFLAQLDGVAPLFGETPSPLSCYLEF